MTTSTAPETDRPIVLNCNDAVTAEEIGHVLLVTINRPDARNSVNPDVIRGVGKALEHAEQCPGVWVVVITGAGDKAFCAGADLKAAAAGAFNEMGEELEKWGFAGFVKHHISKPTIAAVNGFALGGGTEIVLASDLAVASSEATFGLPEVKRGIFAGAGGAFRIGRQVPKKIAMEILLTGQPLTAQRALEIGLINRAVPQDQVLDAALELANLICENAPLAVQTSKRIANAISDGKVHSEDDDWARSEAEGQALMLSQDSREGMLAFAEKRAPKWQGQ
ncbi:crotonobetainyl-CoA hydratase [Pseudarthrobacter siccitolerans]|uniref:Crotonobetainyl-CoA hydratase n=1 Tax=Pseudarthrobacter siccitolerans TaxID=861266 RepID=A0ABU0PL56_9MICC|nr:crotonase/enoyl-CoA hydratase family protein [Pseudarthrobacter siccitolerans]MDQ0674698.1 crotonobetainyl-CoA hydratase [Pseudarthrobacter siccitolerans]